MVRLIMCKNIISKILSVFVLSLLLICNFTNSKAGVTTGYGSGKGPLKVTEDTANVLEYFFSGGTRGVYAEKQDVAWKPGLIAISIDGAYFSYFRHPAYVDKVDNKHYAGMAIKECKKKSGQDCFLFANAYKIVWDNGSDKKKRRLKRKDIRSGKTIALLTELGFYDDGYTASSSNTNSSNTSTQGSADKESDIVQKIKDLKKLYDDGVLTKEEFEKAKKRLLN